MQPPFPLQYNAISPFCQMLIFYRKRCVLIMMNVRITVFVIKPISFLSPMASYRYLQISNKKNTTMRYYFNAFLKHLHYNEREKESKHERNF